MNSDHLNPVSARPSRSLWPHAILAWFVVFSSAMAAWITFALRQNTELVSADYYEEEVRFQSQLDRLNRTAAVRGDVAVLYDAAQGQVTLRLPADHVVQRPSPSGRIRFYRPSDARLDFEVPLALAGPGEQRIDVSARRGGQWKVRVQWKAGGQDYFFEQIVVLEEPRKALIPGVAREN